MAIDRRPYVAIAYEHIRTRIFDGDVRPGDWLDVDDVIATLGISRQPVRDAITKLAALGFLEVIPQVGCRVPLASPDDVRDFFTIFAAFEGRMTAFATQRATDADLAHLRSISERIGAIWAGAKPVSPAKVAPQFRALNHAFHTGIHAVAKSQSVEQIGEILMDRFDFYIGSAAGVMLYATRVDKAHDEHEAVLAAMEARDVEGARLAMERHILDTTERVLDAPAHYRERQAV